MTTQLSGPDLGERRLRRAHEGAREDLPGEREKGEAIKLVPRSRTAVAVGVVGIGRPEREGGHNEADDVFEPSTRLW